MNKLGLFVILAALVLTGCAHYMPMSVGMSKQDVLERAGQPVTKWSGENSIECWKYRFHSSATAKGGTWYVIFQNSQVIKIAEHNRDFGSLVIGLPEPAVVELQGPPDRTSATRDTKYLIYKHGYEEYYIRIVHTAVESYGRIGDFDSTKPDEKTLNLNIDDKRKK